MCHICVKLEELLGNKRLVDTSIDGPDRNLSDKQKTIIKEEVQAIVMYDLDTKTVKNLGTWTQPQNFLNDITIALGKKIKFGDGDTYIVESADGKLDFYREGSLVFSMKLRGGQDSIELRNLKRLYFSHDKSTYIASTSTGNGYIFYADGTKVLEFYASGLFYKRNLTVQSPGYLLIQELASDPGTSAGYGKFWTKDDNKLYFRDGDGGLNEVAFV